VIAESARPVSVSTRAAMKRRLALWLGLAAAALPAAEISVGDPAGLAAALAQAKPGDTLVLADGTWRDATLTLTAAGSETAPVTIRAETPGRVVLTGESSLVFAAPHVVVDGLLFTNGTTKGNSVVQFNSTHGRLTNSAIVDYNPPDVATGYYWVYFQGNDNRVDHCYFKGKSHQQPVIGNHIKDSRHNAVDHCHFADIPYVAGRNGREIFRIWGYGGNEELGDDGAFFTIEYNLFDRADGEGAEIISLKSNRNIVRFNTILRTRGGITNRSGNFNTITDNVLLCDGAGGAYGMRITGRHHIVARNYIRGGTFGLHLMAGEFIERDLTGSYQPIKREGTPLGRVPAYNQARENLIADNVLVDIAGVDFLLGNGYKSNWPRAQRVLVPELNKFTGNLVFKPKGGVAVDIAKQDTAPPLDAFHFARNEFSGNRVLGGTVSLAPPPDGIAVEPAVGPPPAPPAILTPADVGPAWRR
jgi:poly(beta-D-mannuronate) lyase